MAYGVTYAPNELLEQLRRGIARVESGGRYDALGPEIKRKTGTDRAYGKYQVMGANIPQWTEQALGRPLTAMEFLRSPEAQEKVFEHQMLNNLHKYGNVQDAASVWFSGRPLAEAQRAGARDVNLGVGDYVGRVLGTPAVKGGVQVAGDYDELYRYMDQERAPAQQAPAAPAPVTPSEFSELYKRMDADRQDLPNPATQSPVKQVAPQPEPDWSMAKGFAHGLTLGGLPYAEAMYETGNIPVLRPKAPEAYAQRVKEIQEARKQYAEQYPIRSGAAEVVGSLAPMFAGMGAVGGAARLGAGAIESAVPAARPLVQGAMRFMGGEAGRPIYQGTQKVAEAMPGIAGRATRLGSQMAYGAGQGAGTAVMGQGLAPEDMSFGDQVRTGAMFGAAAGPVINALFSPKLGGRFAPEIEENLRQKAQQWNKEFDLNVRAGQVAKGAAKEYDLANMPQGVHEEQVRRFNEEVKKVVQSELTPQAIESAKRFTGQELGRITQGVRPMTPDSQLNAGMSRIFAEASRQTDPAVRRQLENTLMAIYDSVYAPGGVTPATIQNLFTSGSVLDRQLSGTANEVKQFFGTEIKKELGDFFARKNPNRANLWNALRARYRDLSTLEGIVNESGVVNPKAVSKAVGKRGSRTAMERLGEAGEYLPGATNRGEAVGEGKHVPFWQRAATYWPTYGLATGPAGYLMNAYYPHLFEHLPVLSQFHPLTLTAAGTGAAIGKMGIDAVANNALASRVVNNRLLANPPSTRMGPVTTNVLRGSVGFFPERFGQASERKKK